jgi:hypothetical protein
MANRKKLLFWAWFCRVPLFERFTGLLFPFCLTVILTIGIDICLRKIPGISQPELFTFLSAIVVFFIVLWLQQLVLAVVFRKALHDFLNRTKGCHPVTKIFGAEILRRFLSDGFKEEMLKDVESLTAMLQRLEQKNGYPLAPTCYAILLDKAAGMGPDCLWAVWDFESVPIEEVFDAEGRPKPEYDFYFRTLSQIYVKIKDSRNRKRIFVFSDNTHRNKVVSHPGWQSLLKMHKDWKFEEGDLFECTLDTLKGAKKGWTAVDVDDFVFFKVSGILSHAWVIGFAKDHKVASLRHGDVVIEDTQQTFNRLFAVCPRIKIAT